jgi:hypothetical protein
VLACVLVVVPAARADLIPPGTKNIPIEYKIETDAEHADWAFFVVHGSGGIKQVKFDPKNPVTIPGSSGVGNGPVRRPGEKGEPLDLPYRASTLVAVPKNSLKKYAGEKELYAAIADGKVEGQVRAKDAFRDHENAKVTDPRKSITRRFKVTKVDAKGIVLEAAKADPAAPGPGEEEEASARPPVYLWVAVGLAAAGSFGFAGFWYTRRTRRIG